MRVTASFFTVLGVAPMLGRTFTADEEQPGADRVVVLSYGLWKRRYGADPTIVGRTIPIDSRAHVVVGVMPPAFRFHLGFERELWVPAGWTIGDQDNDNFLATFSIRREGEERWTDVVANTTNSFAQFDTRHMADGVYFTRLVATETAPRPADDRLTQTFETDDLIVDHTTPEIVEATATRNANAVVVSVRGRDRLSLLNGVEIVFNNNVRETVEQPEQDPLYRSH